MKTTHSQAADGVEARYHYDFGPHKYDKDWAQIDTTQDAGYFGQWAQPFERKIVCYAEGDLTTTECDNDEEFVAELSRIAEYYLEQNCWRAIDTFNDRMTRRFLEAGARHLLYPTAIERLPADEPAGATPGAETGTPIEA